MSDIKSKILSDNECLIEFSDSLATSDVAESLKIIGESLIDKGCRWLILDFNKVNFIDSICLGALLSLLRKTNSVGGGILLFGLNANVRNIISVTGLDKVFVIVKSVGEARLKIQEGISFK